MGVLLEQCCNCGSTKVNSGLLSSLCPNCGMERELIIGPGGNNYGDSDSWDLKTKIERVRQTVIEVHGSDEGVPTVDEVLKQMERSEI